MIDPALWPVVGERLDESPVESLTPDVIFVYYDGPLVFTTFARDGSTMLAWWVDCEWDGTIYRWQRYLLVPFDESLMGTTVAARSLLDREPLYVVDVGASGMVAWRSNYSAIPNSCLPTKDARATLEGWEF